jgi:hypothetical protein
MIRMSQTGFSHGFGIGRTDAVSIVDLTKVVSLKPILCGVIGHLEGCIATIFLVFSLLCALVNHADGFSRSTGSPRMTEIPKAQDITTDQEIETTSETAELKQT